MRFLPVMTNGDSRVSTRRHGRIAVICGRALACMATVAALAASSGCQCCCCGTNAWSAVVDCGVDHAIPFDCLYCSKLDLTRINCPCGIQCGCCCRPTACCSASGVYAHRWNSPPPEVTTTAGGLQSAPTFPAPQPGPYFPPTNEATPLFEAPAEETRPPVEETPVPPQVQPDSGVLRMHYTAPQPARSGRVHLDAESLLLPTDVLFGN